MANEQIAVVTDMGRERGGYPTYATETGNIYGYNIRARQSMHRAGYRNAYDLNNLNPALNKLEFVQPLYRRNSHGYRVQYPEQLEEQPPLSKQPYLLFPPTAPRQPFSQPKYNVPVFERKRMLPESKYKYCAYNVPPSEKDIHRYPGRNMSSVGRPSQSAGGLVQPALRTATPQQAQPQGQPMRSVIPQQAAARPWRSTYEGF